MHQLFRIFTVAGLSLTLAMAMSCGGDKQAKSEKPGGDKTEKPAAGKPSPKMAKAIARTTEAPASRQFILDKIGEWGECRNVALTQTSGDMAFYDLNGYAQKDCPDDLVSIVQSFNEEGEYIDDVQLTENGSWVLLYGRNGLRWNGIPESLIQQLGIYNENNEVINSVTLNDNGDWIVITDNRYAASSEELAQFIGEGESKHGELWAACLTNDAMVAVYERGYKYTGNIPETLLQALDETDINVYRLKLAGDSWFFADKEGHFEYYM